MSTALAPGHRKTGCFTLIALLPVQRKVTQTTTLTIKSSFQLTPKSLLFRPNHLYRSYDQEPAVNNFITHLPPILFSTETQMGRLQSRRMGSERRSAVDKRRHVDEPR